MNEKVNNLVVGEKGLIMRPKKIKVAEYATEYDDLLAHINSLIEGQDL